MVIPVFAAASCGALFAAAVPVRAQMSAPSLPAASAAAVRAPMSLRQIVGHAVTLGYRDIKEVERKSDKLYEPKARDAKGLWVELYVDARSGEILKLERDR